MFSISAGYAVRGRQKYDLQNTTPFFTFSHGVPHSAEQDSAFVTFPSEIGLFPFAHTMFSIKSNYAVFCPAVTCNIAFRALHRLGFSPNRLFARMTYPICILGPRKTTVLPAACRRAGLVLK